jgi:hypothetical protein
MQTPWRVYLVSALVACVVASATAFVTVRLLVSSQQSSPSTMILDGVVEAGWGEEPEVFYKAPFAAPPNLTFPDGLDNTRCQVTDQKAGSFKLKRGTTGFPGEPTVAK